MKFLELRAIHGPNMWSRRTVLEALVDLEELRDSPSDKIPGLYDRLVAWLPTLIEHRCGLGVRGGFLERLRDGTYAGHILEHLTIELQNQAGTPVGFGKARETREAGVYKVAVRYREEAVGRACLAAAFELLQAAIHDRPFDIPGTVARLKSLAEDVCLGPSTLAIVTAAEARGIPVRRLNDGSLVQLGHGARSRRVWTAETDRTGAIAEAIACDKELTKSLLRAGGVSVPQGRPVSGAEDAWAAAQDLGLPVVVKPRDGNHGRAVFTQLDTRELVENAWRFAAEEGSGVLVEQHIEGEEHRLLVVGDRMVAAARGEAAWVTGDGTHPVRELVELQLNSDPRRGYGDECPLNPVELDAASRSELERQGLNAESIPAEGTRVLIQRNGNVAHECTDRVHPSVADQVVLAARIVGLDIAGVDLVAKDISRPLEEQRGGIVEVNAGPGLHMHLLPASGSPRPVGEAIVELLFPVRPATGGLTREPGRIPVACVTGTRGKTTVCRLVVKALATAGPCVGFAGSDGAFVGPRQLLRGDCAGPEAARDLLLNTAVEAAVFEAGAEGILRDGLGFDRCDVAVVTNLGEVEPVPRYRIETPDEMYTVKRCPVDMVPPSGAAVLKADDPQVAEMAGLSAGRVIFFAIDPAHPVLAEHRGKGGWAAFVRDGKAVLAEGASETALMALADVPLYAGHPLPFQAENVLAAAAACWALGIPLDTVRQAFARVK